MIAKSKPPTRPLTPQHQAKFLRLLPLIARQAKVAFQGQDSETREELTAEVIANAYVCFARLVERGRESLAFGTPLGMYAVRQVRSGRRVGGKLNVRDITSRRCQVVKGVRVESLDGFDDDEEEWKEILLEDRHAGPAEIAASRIDFAAWLGALSHRNRRIATTLATGETTLETAKRFDVSSGRISQIRGELKTSWMTFQGEPAKGFAVS
jgi:hypothetical protein